MTFRWTLLPAYWTVPAEAVALSHRHTTFETMRLLDKGHYMMSRARIELRAKLGRPTPIPPDVKVGPAVSRGRGDLSFGVLYADDIAHMHAQHDDGDDSGLQVSASVASDCVRVFGPSDPGEPPILSQAKNIHREGNLTFLGWDIKTLIGRISRCCTKISKMERLPTLDESPSSHEVTLARGVLSLTSKLGNLASVFRVGTNFVW